MASGVLHKSPLPRAACLRQAVWSLRPPDPRNQHVHHSPPTQLGGRHLEERRPVALELLRWWCLNSRLLHGLHSGFRMAACGVLAMLTGFRNPF